MTFCRRIKGFGIKIAFTAAVFLYLASIPLIAGSLGKALESNFQPFPLDSVQPAPCWIAILGSGARNASDLPATQKLHNSSLVRLIEGVRISKHFPNTTIVVSGGRLENENSTVQSMYGAALELGIDEHRILRTQGASNTDEEIAALAQIVGHDPGLIVTSALHMARVSVLAQAYELNFRPAPCQFRTRGAPPSGWHRMLLFVPSSDSLSLTDDVFHEHGGRIWLRLSSKHR